MKCEGLASAELADKTRSGCVLIARCMMDQRDALIRYQTTSTTWNVRAPGTILSPASDSPSATDL